MIRPVAGARRHGHADGIVTEGPTLSEVLSKDGIDRSLRRISHEILERNASSLNDLALVGVLTRGVPLAHRIARNIEHFESLEVPVGSLDITLHRDDRDPADEEPRLRESRIPFDVAGKMVVLVDDVLYTGRTARAAMDALLELGRPAAIRLAILVDRGHRELPIRADHVGKNVPTSRAETVRVRLVETDGEEGVVRVAE
ncbi:MAG TPA: bifunctional pyr operon transcriptional regulator/uracil phosphoribosyltransferase PyrR [Rubrobacteraceae bacterium]|nr:bifunctional pyr operon transcriptional regulator/uracil phosphoribosyltransferase PyrR [Rubrobacteraceae bacterium]